MVADWKQAAGKMVHDPFVTLALMENAYTLSVDPEVKTLLGQRLVLRS